MPVMDKLEEISSGKKEAAPAAENDATSVGEGRSLLPRPGLPTPGGKQRCRLAKLLPASGRMWRQ